MIIPKLLKLERTLTRVEERYETLQNTWDESTGLSDQHFTGLKVSIQELRIAHQEFTEELNKEEDDAPE